MDCVKDQDRAPGATAVTASLGVVEFAQADGADPVERACRAFMAGRGVDPPAEVVAKLVEAVRPVVLSFMGDAAAVTTLLLVCRAAHGAAAVYLGEASS